MDRSNKNIMKKVARLSLCAAVLLLCSCSEHDGHADGNDGRMHSAAEAAAGVQTAQAQEHDGHDHDASLHGMDAVEPGREHDGHADEDDVHDHAGTDAGEHAREQTAYHDGHEHDAALHGTDAPAAGREHAEHADERDGHNHADEPETEITLAPEAVKLAGIKLSRARIGRISRSVALSGEVGFNEERLMRVTPRFPGIIRETRFRKGEFVKTGQVLAVIESNESMAAYALKAPLSGSIIEKLAVPGEYVSEEKSIYVLADLSTVWVNLAVYPKDAGKVRPGRKIFITALGSDARAEGTVSYVTPVIDAQTRTVTAVVVLPNDDNAWRPGSFVHAHMEAGEGVEGLVVEKDAVQILDNESIVFVQHAPGSFKPVEVVTGESDSRTVLIVSGLKPGDEYVSSGAFELKAKIVTSALGDHVGHGH